VCVGGGGGAGGVHCDALPHLLPPVTNSSRSRGGGEGAGEGGLGVRVSQGGVGWLGSWGYGGWRGGAYPLVFHYPLLFSPLFDNFGRHPISPGVTASDPHGSRDFRPVNQNQEMGPACKGNQSYPDYHRFPATAPKPSTEWCGRTLLIAIPPRRPGPPERNVERRHR